MAVIKVAGDKKTKVVFDKPSKILIEKLQTAGIIYKTRMHDRMVAGVIEMRNIATKSMANTSRAPWFYKKGKSGKTHHPSLPGFPPAIDEGGLVRSADMEVRKNSIEFGYTIGYAPYLEDGTENDDGSIKMEARPFIEPAIEEEWPNVIRDIIKITNEIGD